MEIKIRTVTADDAGDICRLSREELGYECSEELVRERINALDRRREEVFAADIGGEIAGFVHAEEYNTLYCEPMVNYLGVAVSSRFRRMGIGSKLIAAAEEWAQAKGIDLIRLNSGSTRSGAHAFYTKMGYDGSKVQKRFIKRLSDDQAGG